MEFWKYSALGNTFIVVPITRMPAAARLAWARRACHPGTGVGADGAVLIHVPSARLAIYNADGTRASLSGNGARAAAAWWFTCQDTRTQEITWRTDAGPIRCRRRSVRNVEVRLPPPQFAPAAIPARTRARELWGHPVRLAGVRPARVKLHALSVGNPQCVLWGRAVPRAWRQQGAAIQRLSLFPRGVNVAFACPVRDGLEARLWERGVGETESSGTGAAAAAVVAMRLGACPRRVRVHMTGGVMTVHWHSGGSVLLSGRVEPVASGVLHRGAGRP